MYKNRIFMNYFGKNLFKLLIVCIALCFLKNCPVSAAVTKDLKKFEIQENSVETEKKSIENTEKFINDIKLSIEKEHYTEAMLELNRLLNSITDKPELYVLAADLLRKTHQFEEAETMAKKALQLDYKYSQAYLALGNIFFDKIKYSKPDQMPENKEDILLKSFDYYFMASMYDEADPLPHIALAEAYNFNKQPQMARDEILKAQELSFNNPDALYLIGQYYFDLKEYDRAKTYIQKSIEFGRDYNYEAYYLVGKISEQEGYLEKAQKLYLKALKLKPDEIEIQKQLDNLIKTVYTGRKTEEPTDLFENVDSDLKKLLKADYYLILDEYTKARDLYLELLKKDSQNPQAVAGLAELYYSKWKKGFDNSPDFINDAIYIIKSKPDERNKIALIKFQMINEHKIPENLRQKLIKLSISKTFEFYDLLNEIRAEFLLENYIESRNKLNRFLNMNLSNYEKFLVLKHLAYDHNYYEALMVLDDLKKTNYKNEEINPIEKRIKTKIQVADENLDKALNYWEEENHDRAISIYKNLMNFFPTYKPAYLYYGLAMRDMENYDEAYDKLNIYYKLYRLYPDSNPEITEEELNRIIQDLYAKISEQIKQRAY